VNPAKSERRRSLENGQGRGEVCNLWLSSKNLTGNKVFWVHWPVNDKVLSFSVLCFSPSRPAEICHTSCAPLVCRSDVGGNLGIAREEIQFELLLRLSESMGNAICRVHYF
jgi:hypothetical protein